MWRIRKSMKGNDHEVQSMLTRTQRDEFAHWGLLQLPGAVPTATADAMADRIWSFLSTESGVDRADRDTWTVPRPTGFQQISRAGALGGMWSPNVRDAVDDLLGSADIHRERPRVLMTFPQPELKWTIPSAGWHFDYVPPQTEPGFRALQVIVVLNDVLPHGGGTAVLAGSHRLVGAYAQETGLDPRPKVVRSALSATSSWLADLWKRPSTDESQFTDREDRLSKETSINGVTVRVDEITGAPGDVFLMHSDCFHAVTPNTRPAARIMATSVVTRVAANAAK
jgi:Phytanoyl-CoA dioxygenase (PhyH)